MNMVTGGVVMSMERRGWFDAGRRALEKKRSRKKSELKEFLGVVVRARKHPNYKPFVAFAVTDICHFANANLRISITSVGSYAPYQP